jgi:hypothetical protein
MIIRARWTTSSTPSTGKIILILICTPISMLALAPTKNGASIHRTFAAPANRTRRWKSWEAWGVSQISHTPLLPLQPSTRPTGCPTARVNQAVDPKNHRSETHPPATGHNSPIHPGVAMPIFSLQPATISPLPTNFVPSPILTLSHGRKCPTTSDQISVTHLIWVAWFPSSDWHAAPTTPTYNPHALPQIIPNPDDPGPNSLAAAGLSTPPMAHLPSPYIPSHEERELTPFMYQS